MERERVRKAPDQLRASTGDVCVLTSRWSCKMQDATGLSGEYPCVMSALSVIFLHYKHILICVHNAHIAYQPILAKIYLWAAFRVSAQIYYVCSMCLGWHISLSATSGAAGQLGILCMLQSFQPTYILVHYKWCSWVTGNIMHTLNVPADIYPSPLQAVQLTSWEYYLHSNHASWHIS